MALTLLAVGCGFGLALLFAELFLWLWSYRLVLCCTDTVVALTLLWIVLVLVVLTQLVVRRNKGLQPGEAGLNFTSLVTWSYCGLRLNQNERSDYLIK